MLLIMIRLLHIDTSILTLVLLLISAPLLISKDAISKCPSHIAECNGVSPLYATYASNDIIDND